MDSEEQAVPVLLNVLSDILLIKVNLSNNFFQCGFQFFGTHLLRQISFHNLHLSQFCIS